MKKIFMVFFIFNSLLLAQNVEINKEVQGKNKETLDYQMLKVGDMKLDDQKLGIKDFKDDYGSAPNKIVVKLGQKKLEKEISKKVERKKTGWELFIGGVAAAALIIAL